MKIDREKLKKLCEIRLLAEQDEMSVRGNAMASGDDAEDKRVEDEIIKRLDDGDIWAWAAVTVRAEYAGLVGEDHLGGCSYKDAAQFKEPGDYYDDMIDTAVEELAKALEHANTKIGNLVETKR